MSKTWKLVGALLVASGLLVACGGDDDDDLSAAARVNADADVDADEDLDLGDLEDFAFGSEECLEASGAFLAAAGGAAAVFGGGDQDLQDSLADLEEFAGDVPAEIRADFEVFVDAYAEFADAFADLDFDPSSGEAPDEETMAALQALTEDFEESEFQEATENIQAWFEENCEVGGD